MFKVTDTCCFLIMFLNSQIVIKTQKRQKSIVVLEKLFKIFREVFIVLILVPICYHLYFLNQRRPIEFESLVFLRAVDFHKKKNLSVKTFIKRCE